MQKLTRAEFEDRMAALARAKKIFPDIINVSDRFTIYQQVFAERERELTLTTEVAGNRPRTMMDGLERPKCPECGEDMMFRKVPENADGILIQLVCSNPKCDTVLNSDKSMDWWREELKKKDELERLSQGSEANEQKG